jgi:hypothetical protein
VPAIMFAISFAASCASASTIIWTGWYIIARRGFVDQSVGHSDLNPALPFPGEVDAPEDVDRTHAKLLDKVPRIQCHG